MKRFLILALIIISCDPCRHIDCYESGLRFHFRVVDSKGKDLVYDNDVSVGSLSLQSGNNPKEGLTLDDADRCLFVLLSPDKLSYTLSYDNKSTEVTLGTEKVNDGECCGALYETVDVFTTDGRVPVTAGVTSGQKVYIITL